MKSEFSAGGIVYKNQKPKTKNQKEDLLILVCKHSYHHGWVFPKGLIGDSKENKNQTKEETAIREVKEETGVDAEIEQSLESVEYWYEWPREAGSGSAREGEKIKKTVYYFLMSFIGGDITKHDDEMEEVEWLKPSEVENRLTYPSDKKVWKEARVILNL
jgi:8-oxo-dGTP diphosphatase